jgi:hypothetical protein
VVRREVWSVEELKESSRAEKGGVMRLYRVISAECRGVSWDVEGTYNV